MSRLAKGMPGKSIVLVVLGILVLLTLIVIGEYEGDNTTILAIQKYIWLVFILLILWGYISQVRKRKMVNKMKSGVIPKQEILAKVTGIDCIQERGDERGKITGRSFVAEGVNPMTNEPYEFTSEEYPYKKLGFRWFGPTKEDREEFNAYVAQYIKIGDPIKVFVSIEDPDDYYLQELPQSAINISTDEGTLLADKYMSEGMTSVGSVTAGLTVHVWSVRNVVKILLLVFFLLVVVAITALVYIQADVLNISHNGSDISSYVLLGLLAVMAIIIRGIVAVVRSNRKNHEDQRFTHGV